MITHIVYSVHIVTVIDDEIDPIRISFILQKKLKLLRNSE